MINVRLVIKKVDPCLKIYNGAPFMVNDNTRMLSDNVGSGTQLKMKSCKLKKD